MKRAAASAVVLFALASTRYARAEDGVADAAPRVAPYVAVGWNPIGVLAGRYSADAIVFPLPRLAIVGSAHVLRTRENHASAQIDGRREDDEPAFSTFDRGYGGELGLRVYAPWSPGISDARGAFIGVSYLGGSYSYSVTSASPGPHVTAYDVKGGAVDIGFTFVVQRYFVVTVGGGLQYLEHSPEVRMDQCNSGDSMLNCLFPSWQTFVNGSGLRPRLLLTVGFGA